MASVALHRVCGNYRARKDCKRDIRILNIFSQNLQHEPFKQHVNTQINGHGARGQVAVSLSKGRQGRRANLGLMLTSNIQSSVLRPQAI